MTLEQFIEKLKHAYRLLQKERITRDERAYVALLIALVIEGIEEEIDNR